MQNNNNFDVIIIGGSYAGLSAAMALGRALRKVLVIDSGKPCNRYTPRSHNFITHDGSVPADISALAKKQVMHYESVTFYDDTAIKATKDRDGFVLKTEAGHTVYASKIICASGIKDLFPDIPGIEACWGKTVLHCPYCHGFEVKFHTTGILGNGEYGFDFSKLVSNWTRDLTLFTNGPSTLTTDQEAKLRKRNIGIVEKKVKTIVHENGRIKALEFEDGSSVNMQALYTKLPFEQHSVIPVQLGCELTETGHLKIDAFQKTSIHGVFACGDNSHPMRSVSVATAAGTLAGAMANKEMVDELFG